MLLLFQPVSAEQEDYNALLSCAAFHAVEAERGESSNREAQLAASRDFLDVAAALTSAKSLGTSAQADLKQLQTDYARHLREGDAKAMAEQWTALDLACRELYPALGKVLAENKLDDKGR
ncbi:hypothetical protein [Sphingorhabdus pulchriflava]|nr:hypothetical protein [Sphingorhabdus pulchriflava]